MNGTSLIVSLLLRRTVIVLAVLGWLDYAASSELTWFATGFAVYALIVPRFMDWFMRRLEAAR